MDRVWVQIPRLTYRLLKDEVAEDGSDVVPGAREAFEGSKTSGSMYQIYVDEAVLKYLRNYAYQFTTYTEDMEYDLRKHSDTTVRRLKRSAEAALKRFDRALEELRG